VSVSIPTGANAWAVIDLTAIRDNVQTLQTAAPTAQVMAVVKADGYGHGLVPAARAALAGGATWLGTAQADEALALRAAGITDTRILTWLHTPDIEFSSLIAADIDVSISAAWSLDGVADAARTLGRAARVHLLVDTGLGRNGIMPAELPEVALHAARLQAEGFIKVVGLWSHLAYADEPGHPAIEAQREVFDWADAALEVAGLHPEVRHIANSAATLTAPELHYDLVRPGIAIYGFSPVPQATPASGFMLRPAMTLQARLATVKEAPAGHGVSYSHLYSTSEATRLGVVPLGYADGIPRHASGDSVGSGGPVLVGDRVLRVAGRVCMDQFMLDLGPNAAEQAGSIVTLFGATDGLTAGAVTPSAEDWAEAAETISYEIVTRIGSRVPRIYADEADATASTRGKQENPLGVGASEAMELGGYDEESGHE